MLENSKSLNVIFFLYAASVIYLMLCSMHIHFSWGYDIFTKYAINWGVGIIGWIYLQMQYKKNINSSLILVFIFFYLSSAWNPGGIAQILNLPVALLTILFLSNNDKKRLLCLWTNTYSLILCVSVIAYFLTWFDFLTPSGVLSFGNGNFYIYQNYHWLCVRGPYVLRFNSIFLEPGHTAMIGAFTIFANHYNIRKKSVLCILICSLLTLSLAGYVLIIAGFIIYKFLTSALKKAFCHILIYSVAITAIYFISKSYENGNNYVNVYIIERLEYDEEKGIVGNNRYLGDTDKTFEKIASTSKIITGLSFYEYAKALHDETISGAGIKLYLLQKGIVGTIFVFLVYYLICRKSVNRHFMYSMFILYILAFLQRAYPLWESWIFIFVFSTVFPYSSYLEKNKV